MWVLLRAFFRIAFLKRYQNKDSGCPGTLGFLYYHPLIAASEELKEASPVVRIPDLSPHNSFDWVAQPLCSLFGHGPQ